MASGGAPGLQNQCGAVKGPGSGSIPTHSRQSSDSNQSLDGFGCRTNYLVIAGQGSNGGADAPRISFEMER